MPDVPMKDIKFFYLKSPNFRVVHVDGGLGGVTPRGLIHLAVYSERPAIPQTQTLAISPEGKLGEQLGAESKEGIVRDVDVDLMMTKQTAIEIRDWLDGRIKELTELEAGRTPASMKGKN
jgi:hypothetical protein